jgi:hypothetical protein
VPVARLHRLPDIFCERFEVLRDSYEMALVACTSYSSQAKSFKTVMRLDVRKLHLDFFTLIA